MTRVTIVIPCFNEASRFSESQSLELLAAADISLILVNDGSSDNTAAVLDQFANAQSDRVAVVHLERNSGKAEAVRQGMLKGLELEADIVGYLDADFATPAAEMLRLVNAISASHETKVLLGSRWLHLGADIQRKPLRHYGGRVFATLASMVLKLSVYDTQCGAKLFRRDFALTASLESGFVSSWAFDVELIGRLRHFYAVDAFVEVPLNRWVDVVGSKIGALDMIKATMALLAIRRALSRFKANA